MKRALTLCALAALATIGLAAAWVLAQPEPSAATFLQGVQAYEEGRYAEAASAFESVAGPGGQTVVNPELYYDLGNAWLKAGDVGRAVLWYERAKALAPGDPDLEFNLQQALALARDEVDRSDPALVKIPFFWKSLLPMRVLQWVALGCNAALWLLLTAQAFAPSRPLRTAAWVAMALTLLFTPAALFQLYERHAAGKAIVLARELPVRSGLGQNSTQLFLLHAGAPVRIEGERDGLARIRFGADKVGWVPAERLGRLSIPGS